jgi:hypothetical protein
MPADLLACPNGFVIPDDLSNSRNIFIDSTISQCAISCENPPLFTDYERHVMANTKTASYIVSSLCASLVFVVWIRDPARKNQVFVVAYGAVVGIGFMFLLISHLLLGQKRLCINNTVAVMAEDGLTPCMGEAVVVTFIALFSAACFAMQSVQIFLRVVLKVKYLPTKHQLLGLVFAIPLLLSVVGCFADIYQSDIELGLCMQVLRKPGASEWVFKYPFIILTVIGLVAGIGITAKVLILINAPDESGVSFADGVSMTGTSIKFTVCSGCFLMSCMGIRLFYGRTEGYADRSVAWGRCALVYFDGTEQSYADACGEHPERFISFTTSCALLIVASAGFGIFFVIVNIEGLLSILCPVCWTGRATLASPRVAPEYIELCQASSSVPWSVTSADERVQQAAVARWQAEQLPPLPDMVGGGSSWMLNSAHPSEIEYAEEDQCRWGAGAAVSTFDSSNRIPVSGGTLLDTMSSQIVLGNDSGAVDTEH